MTDPAYGLGHPGGLIVTGGLGHCEPAAVGVMAARITGTATITATLSVEGAGGGYADMATSITGAATLTASLSDGQEGGSARFGSWAIPLPRRRRVTVDLAATITGTGALTATATADDTARVVVEFNRLILDIEGVLL